MKVDVICTKHVFKNDKGEEKTGFNFYLVLENGKTIAIRPSFSNGYSELKTIAAPYKKGDN